MSRKKSVVASADDGTQPRVSPYDRRDLPFIRHLNVDLTSRPGTFRSITDALASIPDGIRTEIVVASGVYEVPSSIDMSGRHLDVEIRGEADGVPVFTSSQTTLHVALDSASYFVATGVKFVTTNPLFPAVLITSGSPLFVKAQLQSVHVDHEGCLLMDHCRVLESPSNGVHITGTGTCDIRKTEFRNALLHHIIIDCHSVPPPIIQECHFFESGRGAIVVTGSAKCTPVIARCVIQDLAMSDELVSEGGVIKPGKGGVDSAAKRARASMAASAATIVDGTTCLRAAIVVARGAQPVVEDNTVFSGVGCGLAVYGSTFVPHRLVSLEVAMAGGLSSLAAAKRAFKKKATQRAAAAAAVVATALPRGVSFAEGEGESVADAGDVMGSSSRSWALGQHQRLPAGTPNATIRRNVFRDNALYGVYVSGAGAVLSATKLEVDRNLGGGCVADGGGRGFIFNTSIQQHAKSPGCWVRNDSDSLLRLAGCKIVQNETGCLAEHGAWMVLDTSCVIEDCEIGIHTQRSGVVDAEDTAVQRCSKGTWAEQLGGGLLQRCVVESNGIGYAAIDGGRLTFRSVAFRRNGVAVNVYDGGGGTIATCNISDSTGSCQVNIGPHAHPLISRSEIRSATAVAMVCQPQSRGHVIHCVFSGHKAQEILRMERDCDVLIERCSFNGGGDGNIVVFHEGAGGTLAECEISDACRSGVVIKPMADPTLRGNTLKGNSVGVELYPASAALLEKNTITDSTTANIQTTGTGAGVDYRQLPPRADSQPYTTVVSKNTISRCEYGVRAILSATTQITRNTIVDCRFGVHSGERSRMVCAGNDLIRNHVGFAVLGETTMGTYYGNVVRESKLCGMWVGTGANPTAVENLFVGHFDCSNRNTAAAMSSLPSSVGTPPSAQPGGGRPVSVPLRLDALSRGSFAGNRFAFNTVGIVAHPSTTALLVRNYFQNNATGLVYGVDPLLPTTPPAATMHRSSSVKEAQINRSMGRVSMDKSGNDSISRSKSSASLTLATGRQSIVGTLPSRASLASVPSLQRSGTEGAAVPTEGECCPSPLLLLHGMLTAAPRTVPSFAEGLIVLDTPDEPDCGGPMLLGNVFLANSNSGVHASAPPGAARLDMDANCFLNQPTSLRIPHADTSCVYASNCLFHAAAIPPAAVAPSSSDLSAVESGGRATAHKHVDMHSCAGQKNDPAADADASAVVGGGSDALRSLLHGCIFYGASACVCVDNHTSNLSLFECLFIASGVRAANGSSPLIVGCSFVGFPAIVRKSFDCARGGNPSVELVSDPQSILWCLKSAAGFLYSPRLPLSRASFAGICAVSIEDAGCVLRQCSVSLYQVGVAVHGCSDDTIIDECCIAKTRDVGLLIDRGGFCGTLSNCVVASNFGYGLLIKGRTNLPSPSTSSPTTGGGVRSPSFAKTVSPRRRDAFAASPAAKDGGNDLSSDASLGNLMDGGAAMFHLQIIQHAALPLLDTTDELEARFVQMQEVFRATEAGLLLPDARYDRPYSGTDKNPKAMTTSGKHPVLYRCPESMGPGIGVCVEPTGSATFDRCTFSGAHIANVVVMTKLKAVLHNCVVRDARGFGAVARIGAAPTLARCHILRNGYCGVLAEPESRPRVVKCVVHGNRIGIFGAGDASVITQSTLVGHSLCAVRATQGSNMSIDKCHVEGNQGGIEVHHSAVLLTTLCVQNNALCGIVVSGSCSDAVVSPPTTTTSRGGSVGSAKFGTASAGTTTGPAVYRDTTVLDSLVRGNLFGGVVLRNGGMCWMQRVLVHKNFHGLLCRTHSVVRASDCTFEHNHVGALLEYGAIGSISMSLFARNLEKSFLVRTESDIHVRHNLFVEDAPVVVVMEGRGVFVHNTFRKPMSNCFVISQGGRPTIAFTRFQLVHGSSAEMLHAKLLEKRDPDRMKDLLPSALEAGAADGAACGSPIARRQEAVATQRHFVPTTEELKAFVMPVDESAAAGGTKPLFGGPRSSPQPPAVSPPFASLTPAQSAGLPGQENGSRLPSRGGTTPRAPSSIAFVSDEFPPDATQPHVTTSLTSVHGREDSTVPLQDINHHESASFGEDRALAIMRATPTVAAARRRLSISVHRTPEEALRRKSYVLPSLADDGGGLLESDAAHQEANRASLPPQTGGGHQRKRTSFFVPPPTGDDASSLTASAGADKDNSTTSLSHPQAQASHPSDHSEGRHPRQLSVTNLQQPRRISVHRLDVTFPKLSIEDISVPSAPSPRAVPRTQLQQDLVSDVRDLLQASASHRPTMEMGDSTSRIDEAQQPLLMDHLRTAILIEAGGGGLISNCIFAHNQPCSILCDGPGAHPTIEYCMFYDHRLCSVVVTGNAGAWIHHNLFVRNANAIQSFYADGRLLSIEDNDFNLNLSAIEAIEGDCGKVRQCRFLQDETSILCSSGGIVSVVDCTFANCDDAVIGEPNSVLLMDRVRIFGCHDAVTLQSDEPTTVNPVAHADGTCEVLREVTVQCCTNGLRIGNRRDAQLQHCRVHMCADIGIELTAPSGNSLLAGLPSSVLVVDASIEGCRQGVVIHGDACTPRVSGSVVQFCGTGLAASDGCMPIVDGLTIKLCVRGLSTSGYATGSYRQLNVSGCEAGVVVSSGDEESPLFQHCTIYDCNAVGLHLDRGSGGQFMDGTIFECGVGIMCAEGAYTYLAHTRVSHPSNNAITKNNDALRVAKFSGPRLGPNIELVYQSTPAHNGRTARMRRIDRDKAREVHQEESLPAALTAWDAEQGTLRTGIDAILAKFGMSSGCMQTLPSEVVEDASAASETKKVSSFYGARNTQQPSQAQSAVSIVPAPLLAPTLRLEAPMVASTPLAMPRILQDVMQKLLVSGGTADGAEGAGGAGAVAAQVWTHEFTHKAILQAAASAERPTTLPRHSLTDGALPSPMAAVAAPAAGGGATPAANRAMVLSIGFAHQMDVLLRLAGDAQPIRTVDAAVASAQDRLPFDMHTTPVPLPCKVASGRPKGSPSPAHSPLNRNFNQALFGVSTTRGGGDGSGDGSSSSDTDTGHPQSSRRFRPLRAAHLRRRDSTMAAVYSVHELRSMEDNADDAMEAVGGVGVSSEGDENTKRLLPPLPLHAFRQRCPYPPHVAYTRHHHGASLDDLKLSLRRPVVPSQIALRLLRHTQTDKCSQYAAAFVEAVDMVRKQQNTIFADQLVSVFQALDPRGIEGVTAMDVVGFLEDVVDRCEHVEEETVAEDEAAGASTNTRGGETQTRKQKRTRRLKKRDVGGEPSKQQHQNNNATPGNKQRGEGATSGGRKRRNSSAASPRDDGGGGDDASTTDNAERKPAIKLLLDRRGAAFQLVTGLDLTDEDVVAASVVLPPDVAQPPTDTVDVSEDVARHLLLDKYVRQYFSSVGKVPEKDVLGLVEFEGLISAKVEGTLRAYLKSYFPWMDMAQPMEELSTAAPVGGDMLGRLGKQRRGVAPLR